MLAVVYQVQQGQAHQDQDQNQGQSQGQDHNEWRVSLDLTLRTDLAYWHRRDPSIRLMQCGRQLPFGMALVEAEWRRLALTVKVDPPVDDMDMSMNLNILPVDLLDKLGAGMRGRALLAEEFASLLTHLSLGSEDEGWIPLAQWAYLSGVIRYAPSVSVEESRGWRKFLRKKTVVVCRRCGAGGDAVRWTSCASCGEDCPYCERCLTMGRARFCAPLLLGNPSSPVERPACAEHAVKAVQDNLENSENSDNLDNPGNPGNPNHRP